MRTSAVVAAMLLISAPASAKDVKQPHVYGPAPTWEVYRRIAEADIAGRLIDPESARIEWLGGFFKGEFKPFLAARVSGYVACGVVNARNRMGGYAGKSSFVVVLDYDRVLFADIDKTAGGMTGAQCDTALRTGLLPPLPAGTGTTEVPATSSVTVAPLADAVTGLKLRAMPDGAYISAVTAGSLAANAGLKPGMVITSVNAIPLAGMNDAMLKIVSAAGATAALTLIGGKVVRLGAKS